MGKKSTKQVSAFTGACLASLMVIGTALPAMASDNIPADLLNYSAQDNPEQNLDEEDVTRRAVRDAGRRLGSTTAFREEAQRIYEGTKSYGHLLDEIFDFGEMILPGGIVPPVLARTEDAISYREEGGRQSKEIRAIVLSTVRDAHFANSGGPHWREYLRLSAPPQEHPHPRLQPEIDNNRDAWRQGVEEGYEKGLEQARQAFEIAINELGRDYNGMQLFRQLWLAEMVKPPEIVAQDRSVVDGGRGNSEMSIGVRRYVINEPVYFINDSSEWRALIEAATERTDAASAGLSDIVTRTDNTQHVPERQHEPNYRPTR